MFGIATPDSPVEDNSGDYLPNAPRRHRPSTRRGRSGPSLLPARSALVPPVRSELQGVSRRLADPRLVCPRLCFVRGCSFSNRHISESWPAPWQATADALRDALRKAEAARDRAAAERELILKVHDALTKIAHARSTQEARKKHARSTCEATLPFPACRGRPAAPQPGGPAAPEARGGPLQEHAPCEPLIAQLRHEVT